MCQTFLMSGGGDKDQLHTLRRIIQKSDEKHHIQQSLYVSTSLVAIIKLNQE